MFVSDLLLGKRYLITGGGSGLGKKMARKIRELGGTVCICGRRENVLQETADELNAEFGDGVTWHRLDIRDPEAVDTVIDAVWAEAGYQTPVTRGFAGTGCKNDVAGADGLDAVRRGDFQLATIMQRSNRGACFELHIGATL